MKLKKRTAKSSKAPSYEEIARLLAPNGIPNWLPDYLAWMMQELRHDRLFDNYRPTKAISRARLHAVHEAALLLDRELNAAIRNLLDDARSPKGLSIALAGWRRSPYRTSLRAKFPVTGKNTGKFAESRPT